MTPPPTPESGTELTFRAIACGLGFGVLFGAANAYLGLKAGLTVATSIPIAVLSAAMFRLSKRGGTILEANMAQTIGSASSSLASGTIFTIPALFLWGLSPPLVQVALLACTGGLLGILAMVPLRRLLIVQADAELPYPEGRACAEVLQATEKDARGGRWIFFGLSLGIGIKLITSAGHWLPEELAWKLGVLPNATLAVKVAPALLAVGFIIGYRAAAIMVSGALLTSLVLTPLITQVFAAGGSTTTLAASAVRDRFTLFVGAGAIGAAGLFTVAKTAPTMVRSLVSVLAGLRRGRAGSSDERTDRDLPAWVLVVGVLSVIVVLAVVPSLFAGDLPLRGRILAAIGVTLFGLVFVPVSSRLVGLIGVSSNPTSAMALITLAATAAAFLALGYEGTAAMGAVLTVGTVVCVAASKAGDISQDLKTGWLVRATPVRQQLGQILAALVSCWSVAAVVTAIGNSPEGFGEGGMPAPQARLMKTVVEAVLGASLPWELLLSGAALGGIGILAGLPALPFALGLYLPLSTMAALFVGGAVRKFVETKTAGEQGVGGGVLCASGYVAGEGLAGVGIAGWAWWQSLSRFQEPPRSAGELLGSAGLLVLAAAVLYRAGRSRN